MRVAPLREGHRPGIEPGIDDLGDPAIDPALAGLRPGDGVDPRLVHPQVGRERGIPLELRVEGVEGVRVALEDLGNRGRYVGRTGLVVDPDVERGPPEALARQRPVDVVAQEIAETPVLDVFGKPVDPGVVGERLLDLRSGADVPRRTRELDQRVLLRAHAEGVLVADPLAVPQQSPLVELAGEVAIAVLHPAPGVGRVGNLGIEAAVRQDRAEEGKIGMPFLLAAQQIEVHFAESGCHVDDAGARVQLHEVRLDDPPVGELTAISEEPIEGRRVGPSDQLGAADPALDRQSATDLLGQGLAQRFCDDEALLSIAHDRVFDVRLHRCQAVRRQGPRSGGPDE